MEIVKRCFIAGLMILISSTMVCAEFIDNGDDTVSDTSTGLMWEIKTDDGGIRDKDNNYTWQKALAYCGSLNHATYTDWRLPSRTELLSIVDKQYQPTVDPLFFPNTKAYAYWTFSHTSGASYAFYIDFFSGSDKFARVGNFYYVRAVRGGTLNNPPIYISGLMTPAQGNSGDNFTFECTWNDPDGDYVVDVKVRYGLQGSNIWTEHTDMLAFVPGTSPPQFAATFAVTGAPGTYEYQFQASDANPADGPRLQTANWQGGGTFEIIGATGLTTTILSGPSGTINLQDVTFTWEGNNTAGTVSGYEYELDGQVTDTTDTTASFTGLADGAHVFRVRCYDDGGVYSAWAERTFTVATSTPTAVVTITIIEGPTDIITVPDVTFTWTGYSSEGPIIGYEYQIDGILSPTSDTSAALISLSGGWHTFNVRCYDANVNFSEWASQSFFIQTEDTELIPDFTGFPTYINSGDSVAFTDNSTGNITSWSWSFPGGSPSSSNEQNPEVSYNREGTYNAELTVSDGWSSGTRTRKSYIVVTNNPQKPPKPTGLTGVATSHGSISLKWPAVDRAMTYTLYCSESGSGTTTVVSDIRSLGTDYPLVSRNLKPNTTYYFRLSAVNEAAGKSELSDVVPVTTPGEAIVEMPDLMPSGLTVDSKSWETGSTHTVTISIKNRGNAEAGEYSARLYLYRRGGGNKYIGEPVIFAAQEPGEIQTRTTNITVPNIESGLYSFGVAADYMNDVPEASGETNNQESMSQITVYNRNQAAPDLTGRINLNNTLWEPGEKYTATIWVDNLGGTVSPESYILASLVQSDGTIYDEVERAVGSVEPGRTVYRDISFEIPYDIETGEYRLKAVMDSRNEVEEGDEFNNICFFEKPITVGLEDTIIISGYVYDGNSAELKGALWNSFKTNINDKDKVGDVLSKLVGSSALNGLEGVTISGFPSAVETDYNGYFEAKVPKDYSTKEITAYKDGYKFNNALYPGDLDPNNNLNFIGFNFREALSAAVESGLFSDAALDAMDAALTSQFGTDVVLAKSAGQLLGYISDVKTIVEIARTDKYDPERYFKLAGLLVNAGKLCGVVSGPVALVAYTYIHIYRDVLIEVDGIADLTRERLIELHPGLMNFNIEVKGVSPSYYGQYLRVYLKINDFPSNKCPLLDASKRDEYWRFNKKGSILLPGMYGDVSEDDDEEVQGRLTLVVYWNDWTGWGKFNNLGAMQEEIESLRKGGDYEGKVKYLRKMVLPVQKQYFRHFDADNVWIKFDNEGSGFDRYSIELLQLEK